MSHDDDDRWPPAGDPFLTAPTYASGRSDVSNRVDATLYDALAGEPDVRFDFG